MTRVGVVDTNVAVAANGRDTHADLACQLACSKVLKELLVSGKIILDSSGLILSEYRGHLRPAGQPGIGDVFYKYLLDNQYNADKCVNVDIPVNDASGEFTHFPNDPALKLFDPDDRKFVAVALASGLRCSVINALDTGWRDFSGALVNNGIVLEQVCPQHM